jgi:transcriptional regulator with XRE-family HTH domain
MDNQFIATAIRDARRSRNIKQSDLAARIGISQNYYSELECGKHKFTLEHLEKIGNELGVNYRSFIPPES